MDPALVARLVLGIIFLVSGGLKLYDLSGFSSIVASYSIIPANWRTAVGKAAYSIPFVELTIGILLLLWIAPLATLLVTAGSILVYTTALTVELLRDEQKMNCACYGTLIETPLSWRQVAKNSTLLLLALYLLTTI